jgi:SagB-type dehydrogenase family enzyme
VAHSSPSSRLNEGTGVVDKSFAYRKSPSFRPRFVHEHSIIQLEDGLAIDGPQGLQILNGKAWQVLLPEMIALMDGCRSLSQVASALPRIPREYLQTAVSSLRLLGLVEDGGTCSTSSAVHADALGFLRRYRATTHINQSGLEAYEKLKCSDVRIVHTSKAFSETENLAFLLERSGVGNITFLSPASIGAWRPSTFVSPGKSLIISVSFHGEDCDWHTELDDWCGKHQISWLRAVISENGDTADLGPLFNRNETPCYRCFLMMHSGSCRPIDPLDVNIPRSVTAVFASMVAIETCYLLSDIGPLATGRDFQRYDVQHWESRRLRWARMPNCPNCGDFVERTDNILNNSKYSDRIDAAMLFEDYISLQTRPVSSAPAISVDSARVSLVARMRLKRYPHSVRYPFNRHTPKIDGSLLDLICKDEFDSEFPIALQELETVILTTAGIREFRPDRNSPQRWAATAGNLGSVELFAVVRRVEGLPPGLYSYRGVEHSLARIDRRGLSLEVSELMSRIVPDDRDELPDVLMLFVGAYQRAARKYGPFAYRLINLDAGAAVSQLLLVARSLGITSKTISQWPDDLVEKQLNLEPVWEQSTSVVALRRRNASLAPSGHQGSHRRVLRTGSPRSQKSAQDFREVNLKQAVEMLYRQSRVGERDIRLGVFPGSSESPERLSDGSQCVPLSSLSDRRLSFGLALAERRSVRHYSPDAVPLDDLSSMLYCANHGDSADWSEDQCEGRSLQFVVIAQRVRGLDSGVYSYDPIGHRLSHLTGPLAATNIADLYVQNEFASAPVSIWIFGNLAAACARHGAFGHRKLLLRAGAAGHRLWLVAISVGLSGCLIAGLVPGACRRHLHLGGYRQISLIAFASGYEAKYGR